MDAERCRCPATRARVLFESLDGSAKCVELPSFERPWALSGRVNPVQQTSEVGEFMCLEPVAALLQEVQRLRDDEIVHSCLVTLPQSRRRPAQPLERRDPSTSPLASSSESVVRNGELLGEQTPMFQLPVTVTVRAAPSNPMEATTTASILSP